MSERPRRRKRRAKVEPESNSRQELQALHGQVWDTQQVAAEFVITAIIGNEVVVRRKSDNVVGKMRYQNEPRLYYGFEPQQSNE